MRYTRKKDNHYNVNLVLDDSLNTDDEKDMALRTYIANGFQKLGQLEDIEDELGVDLITFLKETIYVLKHCGTTRGYLSNMKQIDADFGYVEDFIKEMKKALTKEKLL